jgi:tetratricopeptide (TPR) repeat protein
LRGDRLTHLPPPGVLRLVVLSACRTALAGDAGLARALVLSGSAPAAVGMQGNFPDPASAAFAANLYDSLLLGLDLAESLRQARHSLPDGYAGLPAAYVTREGWRPLPLQPGSPDLAGLDAARRVNLPSSLNPPSPFMGREAELHQLTRTLARHPVVTIVGQGGIGKTALAARFAWRWPGGLIGFSLADLPDEFTPETVINGLLARLLGEAAALSLAGLPAERQAEARQRRPLILIDNYETVLHHLNPDSAPTPDPQSPTPANALRLHRLVARLAEAGLNLLLTSRQHPAGLAHEVTFPPDSLAGLTVPAGAELFLRHSSRAKADSSGHRSLAEQVAAATAGHPLAITLLAGEFDLSLEQNPANFLQHWDDELAAARRAGAAPHHETFAVAFARSFQALTPGQQEHLAALGRFGAPFFAQGAALLWGLAETAQAQPDLNELVRRSLLAVDGTYDDDTPATYRLEPVILSHLRRHYPTTPGPAYAAYAAWLVDRCYGETGSSVALAQLLARWWLDELVGQTGAQPPETAAGYCWRLAWLLRQYGRLDEALRLLEQGQAATQQQNDQAMLSNLWYEQAGILVIRGDFEGALKLYTDSLDINEKLGDLRGKAATLHAMAYIFSTRGDFEGALKLYTDSLDINEKLGDLRGKGATLSELANLYMARNDWDEAEKLIKQSLAIAHQINSPGDAAFSFVKLGQVGQARGDLAQARARYQEGLAIFERLGMPREAHQVRQLLAGLEQPGAGEQGAGEQEGVEEQSVSPQPPAANLARLRADLAAQIEAMLPQLPPEQQAQQARQQIEQQAEAVVEAALAAHRDGQVAALLPQLEQAAVQWAEGEEPGSPWANLAQLTRAAMAVLQGQPPEPVAPEYVTRLAALQQLR